MNGSGDGRDEGAEGFEQLLARLETLCRLDMPVTISLKSGATMIAVAVSVSETSLILDRWSEDLGCPMGDPFVLGLDEIANITVS